MALSFKLYNDIALTSVFNGTLQTTHNTTGSTGRVDSVLYLGSTTASKTLQADSDPGVDQITLTAADSAVAAALPVWFGVEAAYLTVGVSTELSIATNTLRET